MMIPKICWKGIMVYAEARDWTRVSKRFETNPNATLPRVAIKAFPEFKRWHLSRVGIHDEGIRIGR